MGKKSNITLDDSGNFADFQINDLIEQKRIKDLIELSQPFFETEKLNSDMGN